MKQLAVHMSPRVIGCKEEENLSKEIEFLRFLNTLYIEVSSPITVQCTLYLMRKNEFKHLSHKTLRNGRSPLRQLALGNTAAVAVCIYGH